MLLWYMFGFIVVNIHADYYYPQITKEHQKCIMLLTTAVYTRVGDSHGTIPLLIPLLLLQVVDVDFTLLQMEL